MHLIRPSPIALLGAVFVLFGTGAASAAERVIYKQNSDRDLAMTIIKPPGWAADDRRPGFLFFYNGGWQDPANTKPQFTCIR